MRQASFAQFTCLSIDVSNLLEARMIITSYNQHVRLLSSEPFGWFAPPKFTRPRAPTLFMESLPSSTSQAPSGPVEDTYSRFQRTALRRNAFEPVPLLAGSP